ncbi:EAL domain-containing protein [Persephonella sp.]
MLAARKKNIFLLATFLIISLAVYSYIYLTLPLLQQRIENRIIKYSVENVIYSVRRLIKENTDESGFISSMLKDASFRNKIKEKLQLFTTDKLKHIFVVYKDDSGKYRYIVDVSTREDVYNFLFIPLKEEKDILDAVYRHKKPQYVIHKDINTIGITYFEPVVKDGKVTGTVIIDFSLETLKEIENLVGSIKAGVLGLATFTVITLFFIFYYFIKSFILKQRAYTDSLTGVFNRNYLEEIADVIDLKDYIVMLVDIDHFKRINDTYGHEVGDEVLMKFAELIKQNLRKDDIIIRYGGEEFLVLLKNYRRQKKDSLKVAERLMETIEKTEFSGIRITVSIGINMDTDKSRNLTDAIKKADTSLYKAKREGRNRIEIFTETKDDSDISLSQLKEIIENGQVICYYQPVVNLKSKKPIYYEALARIIYQDKIFPPAKYIDQIKGTFLYSKFTKNVIEYNIKTLEKYPDLNVSINLAPTDFLNESILHILMEVDDAFIKRIKLEVIETEDIADYDLLKENIDTLNNRGYEIALDDFGRGYINFYYLTEINSKYLKIDGSVIKNISQKDQYCKIVKNLVNYCKDTNKIAIAEFVENEEIYHKLIELGFEYGQGYYFSKPKPVDEMFG